MLQGAAKKIFLNHHSVCDIGISLILPPSHYPLTQSNKSSASSWISFSILELYINGIMKYIFFRVWLLSLKKILWYQYFSCLFFLFLCSIPLYEYAAIYLSFLLLVDIWVGSSLGL